MATHPPARPQVPSGTTYADYTPNGGYEGAGDSLTPLAGLSGYTGAPNLPRAPLVGVFLAGSFAPATTPATLSFTSLSFTALSPALGQVFLVGTGLGAGNAARIFAVPAGATALFVGIVDGYTGAGIPGCYGDNIGQFGTGGTLQYAVGYRQPPSLLPPPPPPPSSSPPPPLSPPPPNGCTPLQIQRNQC